MMVHVGLSNYISSDRIVAIKRFTNGSRVAHKMLKDSSGVMNLAGNKTTRSLIVLTGGIIVKSIVTPETIIERMGRLVEAEYSNMVDKATESLPDNATQSLPDNVTDNFEDKVAEVQ